MKSEVGSGDSCREPVNSGPKNRIFTWLSGTKEQGGSSKVLQCCFENDCSTVCEQKIPVNFHFNSESVKNLQSTYVAREVRVSGFFLRTFSLLYTKMQHITIESKLSLSFPYIFFQSEKFLRCLNIIIYYFIQKLTNINHHTCMVSVFSVSTLFLYHFTTVIRYC